MAWVIAVLAWASLGDATAAATDGNRVEALVGRLFELADSGRLIEPAYVAQVLGVPASFSAETQGGGLWDCSLQGVARRLISAAWTPPWAQRPTVAPLAAGVEVPAEALEWAASAVQYGSLKVDYHQWGDVQCPAGRQLQDRREATISFEQLPAFACVASSDVFDEVRQSRFLSEIPLPRPHDEGPLVTVFRRVATDYRVTVLVEHKEKERCVQRVAIRQEPVSPPR